MAYMVEMVNVYRLSVGKPEGAVGEDGRIALKWIFKNQDGIMWTCFRWWRVNDECLAVVSMVMKIGVL